MDFFFLIVEPEGCDLSEDNFVPDESSSLNGQKTENVIKSWILIDLEIVDNLVQNTK